MGIHQLTRNLLIAGAVLAAGCGAGDSADLVFTGGPVLTLDPQDTTAEAVAVRGDRISAVGSASEVLPLVGSETRVVDLTGRALVPGFVDGHSHFLLAGQTRRFFVDLNAPPIGSVATVGDAIAALAERATDTPRGEWIAAMGYDDTLLAERRHLDRGDLDRASEVHPILALHVSGHIAAANSHALELAGIDGETPQPEGGLIRKDPDGEPTGVLEEAAAFLPVLSLMPQPELDEMVETAEWIGRRYASRGVTTAQDGLTGRDALIQLATADARGKLPIRVVAWPDYATARALASGELTIATTSMLHVGAMKAIADGSIQGYTGYLSDPYHVPPGRSSEESSYRGYPTLTREQLAERANTMYRAGRQVAFHGNGDAAIDLILETLERAQNLHPRADPRPVVVHSQMAREDQLDRMAELGVIPSFFVLHTYYWGDRHREIFMGPKRAARISPLASAARRGIRFTIHCDTPVVPMDPMLLLWSAVNRITTSGRQIGPEQRISPLRALRAMAIDAAHQHFLEKELGSIEVGKLADLVVLSANPLSVEPETLREIEIHETFVGGRSL